jgi:cytochrome c-type biogenesis protein CcmH
MRREVLVMAVGALLVACGRSSSPLPPPSTTAAAPGPSDDLRPLTSRDGDAPSRTAPGGSLPPGHPPIGGDAPAPGPVDESTAISGTVTAGRALASKVPSGATLYVIVRNAATQQIVAVSKVPGVTLPASFRVSAADAMTVGTTFTGPFDLTARLSRTGDAMPASGDIEGNARGVAAGASGVAITLDTVRP